MKKKVSDLILDFFLDKGIDTCFCVTGGGAMHLNDSFGHHKGFKNIYNHHEQASAMAAEGYARSCLKPAIVSVTSGPGATNAITGVLGAWLDSIPMIVISGQMKSETILSSTPLHLRYLGFQESNIVEIVSSITKYSISINSLKDIKFHLEKAYHLANTGRKGPVWIDIPLDIQGSLIEEETFKDESKFVPDISVDDIHPEVQVIDKVIEKLERAKKPVLMLGDEVRIDGAREITQDLINLLKIPVVTEWNSHDLVDHENEFYSGRPGTIGDRGGNYVVQNADLLITIGCQLSIRQISYEWDNFAKNAYKISSNIDSNELQKPTINIDLPIVSTPTNFIKALLNRKKIKTNLDKKWLKWCKEINLKYPVVKDIYYNINEPLNVYPFIKELSNLSRANSQVILANGAACVCGLQAYEIRKNNKIFTNAGASSMGYGISAAIGASVASGNAVETICIEGDGSIMMNLHELQTIVENNLNIKVFVLNNNGYHSIRQTQKGLFNAGQKGYCGADKSSGISFPNLEKIALAFEMPFFRIKSIKDIEYKLKDIVEFEGFALCEVVIDPDQNFEPKLGSKMNEDGTFSTPSLELMSPLLSDKEHEENTFE